MKKFIILYLLICVTLISNTPAFSQDPAPGFEALNLRATPEKTKFVLGEPLTLKLQLANPTQSIIDSSRTLDFGYGNAQLYMSRPGGTFKLYLGPDWGIKERAPRLDRIAPGESIYSDITILFNNAIPGHDDVLENSTPINEAGTYKFRVEFYDAHFRQKIVSPIVEARIDFPAKDGDRAIWQAIQSDPNLAYFLQTGSPRSGQGILKKAEQLISQYPNSVHQKYLALALGKYYLEHNTSVIAMRYLKEAAESAPESFLRAQALFGLSRSYVQIGELDEALKISDAASKEYTSREVQQDFDRLSVKIRQAKESMQSEKKKIPQ